jgi:hypothetical protein
MNIKITVSIACLTFLLPLSSRADQTTFFGIPLNLGPDHQSSAEADSKTVTQKQSQIRDLPSTSPTGQRILILFDVSRSVLNKAREFNFPMSRIQDEVLGLIEACPEGTSIGIIQFTQNFKPYSETLVSLDNDTRDSLRTWIAEEWTEAGTMASGGDTLKNKRGIVGVLEFAARMQPDQIFLVSDGSFRWKEGGFDIPVPWQDIQSAVTKIRGPAGVAKLNFIGFQTKQKEKAKVTAISISTGGKVSFIE